MHWMVHISQLCTLLEQRVMLLIRKARYVIAFVIYFISQTSARVV